MGERRSERFEVNGGSAASPDEIARDIRRTRAEMSETVDAIERKLSPDRLRHELKESLHEGIDTFREQFNPGRIARETGKIMLETIRENPLPSLIAGLSVGWLIMKGKEPRDEYPRGASYGREYERAGYEAYGYSPFYEERDYGVRGYMDYPGDGGSAGRSMRDRARERTDDLRHRASELGEEARERATDVADDVRHRASETADEVRQRASELADDVRHRASDIGEEARHRMEDWGHEVQYRTRRARSSVEQFVDENPLAAGAIAAGVGALLGSLLPSTRAEDEWVGETRDRLVHQARDAADHTIERSKPIARDLQEEVKRGARQVAETAREEAAHIAETAKDDAGRVAETAREGVREATEEDRRTVRPRT